MTIADALLWLTLRLRYYYRCLVSRRPVYVHYVTTVEAIPDGDQGQIARDENPGHMRFEELRIVNREFLPEMPVAEHDEFCAVVLVSYNATEMFGLFKSEGVQALRADWGQE